jgi:sigma-B regulation protein RsbU (phosphoserine phosphatase)
LLYANAGHPRPLVVNRSSGHFHELPPTTLLLGVQSGESHESCHQFHRDDRLVLFTDGLTEVRSGTDERFGEDRLARAVVQHARATPEELVTLIFAETRRFSPLPPDDDQTLVVLDFERVSESY